jgi:hypothetical protein
MGFPDGELRILLCRAEKAKSRLVAASSKNKGLFFVECARADDGGCYAQLVSIRIELAPSRDRTANSQDNQDNL